MCASVLLSPSRTYWTIAIGVVALKGDDGEMDWEGGGGEE